MSLEVNRPKFQRISEFFEQTYADKAEDVFLQSAVLEQVRTGALSSGRAAKLLGLDRWQFSELLAEHDVPSTDLTPEELESDVRNLEKFLDS